jgi:pyrimidine oxygenase
MSYPQPSRPLPIVCAGQSADAIAFTARHADIGFVGRMRDSPQALGALNQQLKDAAAAHGRQVGAYALLNIVAAPTEAEAQARQDDMLARSDEEGIAEWLRASGRDPTRNLQGLDKLRLTFMSFPFITASYADVAARLDEIAAVGVKGVCLMFPEFVPDLRAFIAEVMPRMKSRQ